MQKEACEEFDVLIIADNPSLEVLPTTHNKSWALQRLGGFTLLDFCLEWVSWFDSPNVIVATSTLPQETCDQIKTRWDHQFHANIRVLSFRNCVNVNDLLREVESRQLITRDFILIDNVATFCNTNLAKSLPVFKSRLRQNRNNVLTLLYSAEGSLDCPTVGIQNYTNKLMLYSASGDSVFKVSKNLFVAETTFRSDLSPCGIALCAHEFSGHFSANYDFQNFDRIIHDVLSNEEFLGQNIHIEIINSARNGDGTREEFAFSANNYPSLLRAQALLLKRECMPVTFESILPYFKDFERPIHHKDANIYVARREPPMGDVKDAVFGRGFLVHETATVQLCTFGTNAKIGKGAVVRNCICGDSVQIGENCVVEDSILENNISIGGKSHVKKCCYIGANISLPSGTTVNGGSVLQSAPPAENLLRKYLSGAEAEGEVAAPWTIVSEKENDYYTWWLKRGKAGRRLSFWYLYSSPSSSSASGASGRSRHDSARSQSSTTSRGGRCSNPTQVDVEEDEAVGHAVPETGAYQGNVERFFEEVVETMNSLLLSDGVSTTDVGQVEKMKLEINASRLTNNVSVEDSSKSLFHAFLSVPGVCDSVAKLTKLFTEWRALWKNYYKRPVSQLQMLHAVEEYASVDDKFQRMVPKFVQFLSVESYLPDEVILEWYEGIPNDLPLSVSLAPLMEWIRDAEEESSSEEESEDEN